MGFSALGLAVSIAVLSPNLLLLLLPPHTPIPTVDSPRPMAWIERLGQALCLTVPAFTAGISVTPLWGFPLVAAMLGYWALWARYFVMRTPDALFMSVLGVPVPMAILPVCAFLACGLMLGNPFAVAASVVLAAGHVPMSLLRARAIEQA